MNWWMPSPLARTTNGNSGTVTILGQDNGTQSTATAIVTTKNGITYIETDDAAYIWNATEHTYTGAQGPRLINDGYAVYPSSSSAISFSKELSDETQAPQNTRYWVYEGEKLAGKSVNGNTTRYMTFSSSFAATEGTPSDIYIYEETTITEETETFTVTFDSNGGSAVEAQTVASGHTATEPTAPTREGYTFTGWTLNNADYDFTTPVTGNITLVAQWEEDQSTAGNAYIYTESASAGSEYIVVSNGYALQNNNGTIGAVAVEVNDNVVIVPSTVDITTILWSWSGNGDLTNNSYYLLRQSGSGAKEATLGTTDSGNAYSNNTYTGEYITTTGGGGGTTPFYLYYNSGWYTNNTNQNITTKLYAPGQVVTYTVTFDSNGGSAVEAQTVASGHTATEPTAPTREDYTFTGWTLNDADYDFNTPVTTDITLVAQWAKATSKTVYKLVSTVTSGKDYLIVNSNTVGDAAHAVSNSSGNTATDSNLDTADTEVEVKTTTIDGEEITYVETNNSYAVWTAGTNSSSTTFKNGEYYLYHNNGTLYVNTSDSKNNWTVGDNTLYYRAGGGNSSSTTYYLTYSSGWTLANSGNVYIYEETTIDIPDETVPTITATPDTVTVEAYVGSTNTATFTVSGENLTGDIAVALSTEAGEGVFAVDTESIGQNEGTASAQVTVTFNAPEEADTYTATITLSSDGAEDVTVNVTATAKEKETVTLTFVDGETTITELTKNFSDELTLTTNCSLEGAEVTLSVPENNVVTYNEEDGFEIVGIGTVVITATYEGDASHADATATLTLTVNNTLTFEEESVELTEGDDAYTQTATPGFPVEGATITYNSSDADVATVDEATGEVTAVAAGEATITATWSLDGYNEVYATYTVTVRAKPVITPVDPITMTAEALRTSEYRFTLSGQNLQGDIEVNIDDTENYEFSIEETEGSKVVVLTFKPQTEGEHNATITLSSLKAEPVTVTINGTATKALPDYYTLNITNAGIATMYLDYPVEIPYNTYSDLYSVYYIYEINGTTTKGKRLDKMIPANTGVIVQGSPGSYDFPVIRDLENTSYVRDIDMVETYPDLLSGRTEDTVIAEDEELSAAKANRTLYVLGKGINGGYIEFNHIRSGLEVMPKNRIYLIWNVNSDTTGDAKGLSVIIDDEEATGIDNFSTETSEDGGYWYNLQGVRLNGKPTQRGVYIHNGQRVSVK